MGRLGVSEGQVFQAAAQLAADGVRPSVDAVRIALGNTGSRTTINKYLKAWRERQSSRDAIGADLGDHLRHVIAEQAARLLKALEAESEARAREKLKALDSNLAAQDKLNKRLELTLSAHQRELAALNATHQKNALAQLQQRAELADLREQNAAYREALGKEIRRRETLERALVDRDRQLAALQKKLQTALERAEKGRKKAV